MLKNDKIFTQNSKIQNHSKMYIQNGIDQTAL